MAFQEEHIPFILSMTGMSRTEYNTLFFDQGIEYLRREANYDEWGVNMVAKHPMYWAWWKNVWYNFDVELIKVVGHIHTTSLGEKQKRNYREKYHKLHDAHAITYHPPKFIISAAYEKLIVDMKNSENHV